MTTEIHTSAHFVDLHAAAPAAGAIEWLHLVPSGTFSGADGRGPYRLGDQTALMARSMAAGKLAVDECHAIDLAAPQGRPAPARGWIVELQSRSDGIWGRVEWTPTGAALMAEKAYLGLSPALMVRRGSAPLEVVAIARASLTNDPNLPLTHLHHREADTMSLPKEVLQRLGLAETADEAAIAAAIGKTLDTVETHAKTLTAIATATAAPKDASADQLVTHLQSVAVKAAGAGDVDKMAATIVELQGRLDKVTVDTARERAERVVDAAIAEGKPIKALRDHYIARHAKDPAAVETELKALMSVHDGGIVRTVVDKETATAAGATDPREIQRKAELHQKQHGGTWTDAVLAVSGRI